MAEIQDFLSKNAEKQVKDLIKDMGILSSSYAKMATESKKVDEQLTKQSKNTDRTTEKEKILIAIRKERIRITEATLKANARLTQVSKDSNKILIKKTELIKKETKELRTQANESGKFAGAFRKLNNRRTEAARKLRDLTVSQKASTAEIKRAQQAFDRLDGKVKKATNAVRQFQGNVGNYPQLLRKSTSALKGFIGAFGFFGGIALFAAAVRGAFNIVREFDKQIIAVQKTTNLSNAEIKLFKKEAIALGLALKGVSIQGLLKASEVAGQLGVKGRANILKFAEVIEKLKLTSDIIGEESVRSFAKFIEISTDSVENADRLGSVITELGNNFATSESQILKNTIEIQKGIAIYDANAASVIGLGAATNALGSEAEQARSALQTTFKVLNDGAANGKNLEKILKLTGQTAAEFREEFGKDSVKVFQKFVKGLSDSVDKGKNLSNTLSGLGLEQKRTEAVIGVLAKNYNVLSDALERANKEYKTNEALNREAGLSAKSLDSIIKDVSDSWAGLIVTIEDGDNGIATFIKGTLGALSTALEGVALIIGKSDIEFANWKKEIEGDNLGLSELGSTIETTKKRIAGLTTFVNKSKRAFITFSKEAKEANLNLPTEKRREEGRVRLETFKKELAFLKQLKKERDDAAKAAAEEEKKRAATAAAAAKLEADAIKKALNEPFIQRQLDLATPIAEANVELAKMRDIAKDTSRSDVERNQALERAKDLQIQLIVWARELRDLNIQKLELEFQVEATAENALKLEKAKADAITQSASEERIFIGLVREENKLRKEALNEQRSLQVQKTALRIEEQEEIEKWIEEELQAKKDLNADLEKVNEAKLDSETESLESLKDKLIEIFGEDFPEIVKGSLDLIVELFQGFNDLRIQQLSDEMTALNLQRQTALENAEGDKNKEAQINARFDRKEAAIRQKQLKAKQDAALFQIAISIGVGVAKALEAGPGAPLLIAFALALGAAQAAFVKAQKVPKFGKGSKGLAQDTYGEVGDAGRELLMFPSGEVGLAQEKTRLPMPKGTVIKSNPETEKILAANQMKAQRENDVLDRSYYTVLGMANQIAEDREVFIKAIAKQNQYVFSVSEKGVKVLMKNNRGITTYLDNRFR